MNQWEIYSMIISRMAGWSIIVFIRNWKWKALTQEWDIVFTLCSQIDRRFLSTQNSYVELLIPNVMILGWGRLGSWLGYDGRALMNEICALLKKIPQSSPAPFARWGHSKTAICEPGSQLSPDTESSSTLNVDFLTSRMVRNKSLLFKPLSLWHFFIAAWMD